MLASSTTASPHYVLLADVVWVDLRDASIAAADADMDPALLPLSASVVDDRLTGTPGGWVVLADPEGNEFCLELPGERPRDPSSGAVPTRPSNDHIMSRHVVTVHTYLLAASAPSPAPQVHGRTTAFVKNGTRRGFTLVRLLPPACRASSRVRQSSIRMIRPSRKENAARRVCRSRSSAGRGWPPMSAKPLPPCPAPPRRSPVDHQSTAAHNRRPTVTLTARSGDSPSCVWPPPAHQAPHGVRLHYPARSRSCPCSLR
jgi:hypothetical protein